MQDANRTETCRAGSCVLPIFPQHLHNAELFRQIFSVGTKLQEERMFYSNNLGNTREDDEFVS